MGIKKGMVYSCSEGWWCGSPCRDVGPLCKASCLLWLVMSRELNFEKTLDLELPPLCLLSRFVCFGSLKGGGLGDKWSGTGN